MANPLLLSGLGKQANALRQNAQQQISSSIDSIRSYFPKSKNTKNDGGDPISDLVFPLQLRAQPKVHMIKFTCYDKSKDRMELRHTYLPSPANIAINDSATYNTIDLGAIGGALAKSVEGGDFKPSAIADNLKKQMGASSKSFNDTEIAAAASQLLPGSGLIDSAAKLKGRVLLNPNTNTTFSGNGLRSFTFAFTMISSSSDESKMIRSIHHRFRRFVYADSRSSDQNMILAFPPTWTIHFIDGSGEENIFIPRIYSCYLTSVDSTFNSTTNMFYQEDGAPLEVTMSLGFQETRALTRTDIDNLNNEVLGLNRGIDENGVPKISAAQTQAILKESETPNSDDSNLA